MAGQRPGDGKPFPPGPYSYGGHSLALAADGGIQVRPGDTVSGYSGCLYRDVLVGWEEFGEADGSAVKPLADPNRIVAGKTVYHIPTWNAANPPVSDPSKKKALALVDAFEKRSGVPAFRYIIDRWLVAQELRERVLNPMLIDQGMAGLCPSACVIFEEARARP